MRMRSLTPIDFATQMHVQRVSSIINNMNGSSTMIHMMQLQNATRAMSASIAALSERVEAVAREKASTTPPIAYAVADAAATALEASDREEELARITRLIDDASATAKMAAMNCSASVTRAEAAAQLSDATLSRAEGAAARAEAAAARAEAAEGAAARAEAAEGSEAAISLPGSDVVDAPSSPAIDDIEIIIPKAPKAVRGGKAAAPRSRKPSLANGAKTLKIDDA